MNRLAFVVALACAAILVAESANASAPRTNDREEIPAYEPMAVFAPLSGKTLRGEWADPDGTKIIDIAEYRFILNGRALQSTHRLEGKSYGGRTIFFFDESARKYLYHYFTTAGFHTTGAATLTADGFATDERVEGHDTIASVRSKVTFGADEILVDVIYVGKDGAETSGGRRVYKPIADPGPLFPDTE